MIPVHKLQKSMILCVRAIYVMMAMISCLDDLCIQSKPASEQV